MILVSFPVGEPQNMHKFDSVVGILDSVAYDYIGSAVCQVVGRLRPGLTLPAKETSAFVSLGK